MATARAPPRPKRGGEAFARGHLPEQDPAAKKTRFDTRNPSALAADAPEDDVVLDADEIGRRGLQTKRNAVNIDGYDSDSSNDGFKSRATTKASESKKSKEEDVDEMFGDLDDEDEGDEDEEKRAKADKKNVRFIETDEIEGQDRKSRSGGHVSSNILRNGHGDRMDDDASVESSSDSDVADEVRAALDDDMDEELGAGSKKKHAPKLEAFNLAAEKEEGKFDENLNFVRKAKDPDAIHDTWLEGVSKKDMKKAREAADRRDQAEAQRARDDDACSTSDTLKTLIERLELGETILEALARLGRGKVKKKPKWQSKNRNKRADAAMDESGGDSGAVDEGEKARREAVEAITGAADLLMARGEAEIYDADREQLIRKYQQETGETWTGPRHAMAGPGSDSRRWEYRWADGRDGASAHGPYDKASMTAWNDAGYFGEGVEFRVVGQDDWSSSLDI